MELLQFYYSGTGNLLASKTTISEILAQRHSSASPFNGVTNRSDPRFTSLTEKSNKEDSRSSTRSTFPVCQTSPPPKKPVIDRFNFMRGRIAADSCLKRSSPFPHYPDKWKFGRTTSGGTILKLIGTGFVSSRRDSVLGRKELRLKVV